MTLALVVTEASLAVMMIELFCKAESLLRLLAKVSRYSLLALHVSTVVIKMSMSMVYVFHFLSLICSTQYDVALLHRTVK